MTSNQIQELPSSSASEADGSFRIEIFRKLIHLCSIVIPIFYFYTPKDIALLICIPLTIIFLIVDVARYYHRPTEFWFYKLFGWLLRSHERDHSRKRLHGGTYVLIAATLSILIFPKIITVTAFLILIISDLMAALVGRRFGRHRFLRKSLEGSLAFFLSALIVIALTPKIEYSFGEYAIGAAAAIASTIIEASYLDVDDNLSVPISVGVVLWAGYTIIYPTMNIYQFG